MNVRFIDTKAVQIVNTKREHTQAIGQLMLKTYGFTEADDNTLRAVDIEQHIKRFPQGQFVALVDDQVVGFATTMLTDRSPYQKPLAWMDAIGDRGLRAHKPEGT
jgi:hypothetical protein